MVILAFIGTIGKLKFQFSLSDSTQTSTNIRVEREHVES